MVSDAARGLPVWGGYVLPVVGLSFAEGATIGVKPEIRDAFVAALGSTARLPSLDRPALLRVLRVARQHAPHAFTLAGDVLAADATSLREPVTVARAELITADDPAALTLRHRFDGAVFGVRGPRGPLISWAALKCKSDTVWEVAVATEPEYRGRGYARDVVAAAARYTIENGKVCLYVHDHDNRSSAFVARALGFTRYAEIVLAEY
ncbi:MAG: GNAT family N-acetyltransferase [Chloroflexi bacterium]|nr:GNAT family N-acetyltransferase [Chloroflexota bacterium]